jgi:phenylacetic acid degradation operon negative regulatory protein
MPYNPQPHHVLHWATHRDAAGSPCYDMNKALTRSAFEASLERIRRQPGARARPLIFTVLCEAIAPSGGTFSIASLMRMVKPLSLGTRQVRTLIYRLVKENWLAADEIHRRGHYTLTERSMETFRTAFHRSFDVRGVPWNGEWTQAVVAINGGADVNKAVARTLLWRGFGRLAPGVYIHPTISESEMRTLLGRAKVAEHVMTMRTRIHESPSHESLSEFVERAWNLSALDKRYKDYLARWEPVRRALQLTPQPDASLCFFARVLSTNEFWLLSLRDPMIPHELLPANWTGLAARDLCRDMMLMTEAGSARHVRELADQPRPARQPHTASGKRQRRHKAESSG